MLFDKAYAIPQLAGMCVTICLAGVAPHGLKRNVHQNRKHRCSVQAIQHVGNHALHWLSCFRLLKTLKRRQSLHTQLASVRTTQWIHNAFDTCISWKAQDLACSCNPDQTAAVLAGQDSQQHYSMLRCRQMLEACSEHLATDRRYFIDVWPYLLLLSLTS